MLPPLPASAPAPAPASAPARLLIADDNADAGQMLEMILELSGHQVRRVVRGTEAVHEAESFCPHAALLDIGMPDVNGYEVARRIRAADWGRDIKLVAVSGWGSQDDKRRAHEAGFDAHLTKPVDIDTLEALLMRLIGAPR